MRIINTHIEKISTPDGKKIYTPFVLARPNPGGPPNWRPLRLSFKRASSALAYVATVKARYERVFGGAV